MRWLVNMPVSNNNMMIPGAKGQKTDASLLVDGKEQELYKAILLVGKVFGLRT